MNVWRFCTAWPRSFVAWVHSAICALTTDEGRKGWAMLAALGCCVVMTAEVVFAFWWLRNFPPYIFWLACSAQTVLFVVVTGLMVLLGVRRKTDIAIPLPGGGRASLAIDDQGQPVMVTSTPVAPPPEPKAKDEPPCSPD